MSQFADDRAEILNSLAKYCWGYDEANFEMLADSFTADATTAGKVAGTDYGWGPMTGRKEIVDGLAVYRKSQAEQGDQRRHTIHTPLFHVQTADAADVSIYNVIYSTMNGKTSVLCSGWYRAQLVKEADGVWRIQNMDALLDSPF